MNCWVAKDITGEVFSACYVNTKSREEFARQFDLSVIIDEMPDDEAHASISRWMALKNNPPAVPPKPPVDLIVIDVGNRQVVIRRDIAEQLIVELSKVLYPPGNTRVETLVVRCADHLPGWLMDAHMKPEGRFGLRVGELYS